MKHSSFKPLMDEEKLPDHQHFQFTVIPSTYLSTLILAFIFLHSLIGSLPVSTMIIYNLFYLNDIL